MRRLEWYAYRGSGIAHAFRVRGRGKRERIDVIALCGVPLPSPAIGESVSTRHCPACAEAEHATV